MGRLKCKIALALCYHFFAELNVKDKAMFIPPYCQECSLFTASATASYIQCYIAIRIHWHLLVSGGKLFYGKIHAYLLLLLVMCMYVNYNVGYT